MLFILYGVFFNWWLALIGFFIYMGAGTEKQQVIVQSVLRGVTASDAMATEIRTLNPSDTLSAVVEHVHHGCQDDFPVVDGGRVQGVLTRNRLLAAIHEKGLNAKVSDAMERDFVAVAPDTPLEDVYRKLASLGRSAAAVLSGDQIRGMICHESLAKHLAIRAALSGVRPETATAE